jgi:hypothetical protein
MYEYETMWMTSMCMSMRQCGSIMCVNVYLTCGFSYCVCCETMCGNIVYVMMNLICVIIICFFILTHVEGNKNR